MASGYGNNFLDQGQWNFLIAAIGIAFGDLGTAPLYTLKECFHPHWGVAPNPANVLGVLSLIIWTLIPIVVVKFALPKAQENNRSRPMAILFLGLFGSTMILSDGMITPAISILTAMEGLSMATDTLEPLVLPLTITILSGLFFQYKGTSKIGQWFGPAMLFWFISIGLMGCSKILCSCWQQTPAMRSRFLKSMGGRLW